MKENKSKSIDGDNKMDDFVTEIKNNLRILNDDGALSEPINKIPLKAENTGTSRFREMIAQIVSVKPRITIIDGCTPEGDIRFEVPLRSLGLTPDAYRKYRTELSTDFTANFLGEILVRENLDQFVKLLVGLKGNYEVTVNKFEHRKFGMLITKDKCIFALHSSLIQSILMEDIRNELK